VRLTFFVLAAAAALGCSSSSNGSPQNPADAQAPDAGDDAAEAGPVAVDQDPNVYPATHHPMPLAKNFGGPNLYAMKIVTVTFASDAWRDDMRAFDDALVVSDWWKLVGHSYTIDVGTSGGYAELPDTVSNKSIDNSTDIQPFLQTQLANHALPAPDAQTLYVLYYPASTKIFYNGDQSCSSGLEGFHSAMSVQLGAQSMDVPYVVVPRCTTAEADLTFAASHEIMEAASDPFASMNKVGWYILENNAFTGPGGDEIVDICAPERVTTGGYTLSRSWSNEAAAASHDPCQPSDPNRIFYGAVPDTETVTVKDSAETHSSDGYVTLARGSSKDVLVVVFSEAALPSDLALSVVLPSSARGVTASLSKSSGHNGTELIMTMSASSDAATGDFSFAVRAQRSASDFVMWPVVLRLQ
jgi:hypothetical protein